MRCRVTGRTGNLHERTEDVLAEKCRKWCQARDTKCAAEQYVGRDQRQPGSQEDSAAFDTVLLLLFVYDTSQASHTEGR